MKNIGRVTKTDVANMYIERIDIDGILESGFNRLLSRRADKMKEINRGGSHDQAYRPFVSGWCSVDTDDDRLLGAREMNELSIVAGLGIDQGTSKK